MALTYAAERCAVATTTGACLKETVMGALTLERMRADVAEMLNEDPSEVGDDDNLIDFGLDSIRADGAGDALAERRRRRPVRRARRAAAAEPLVVSCRRACAQARGARVVVQWLSLTGAVQPRHARRACAADRSPGRPVVRATARSRQPGLQHRPVRRHPWPPRRRRASRYAVTAALADADALVGADHRRGRTDRARSSTTGARARSRSSISTGATMPSDRRPTSGCSAT